MPKNKPTDPTIELLKIAAYVTAGIFICLLGLSYCLKMPFSSLLAEIKKCYSFLYANPCPIGDINGLNFHVYVYRLIALLCFIAIIKTKFSSDRKKEAYSIKEHCYLIPLIASIVLTWLVVLQTIARIEIFKNELQLVSGKSLPEKESIMHDWTYDFPRFSQALYPGRHRCDFVTNANLDQNPGMEQHRQLAYFFYPNIDIRGIYSELPVDCLVLSKTRKFKEEEIPSNFEIKGVFNARNVLAIKKREAIDGNK